MSEFEEKKQKIISKLLEIVEDAAFWMPADVTQELKDNIGFYVIKELEKL